MSHCDGCTVVHLIMAMSPRRSEAGPCVIKATITLFKAPERVSLAAESKLLASEDVALGLNTGVQYIGYSSSPLVGIRDGQIQWEGPYMCSQKTEFESLYHHFLGDDLDWVRSSLNSSQSPVHLGLNLHHPLSIS